MKAELITELSGFATIEDEWRELAVSRGSAFATPEWVRAWWGEGTGEHRLMIAAVRAVDGSLAGVMPMALEGSGRRTTLRFAGSAMGDRFGPVAALADEGAVAAAALRAIEEAGHAPALTILHRVDADRDWPAQMAAASRHRLTSISQSPAELLYIPTAELDWEGYVATRSQKFRQRVARGLEKALAKEHEYSMRETTDPSTLDDDLATLLRLHDLRHADTSSISSPRSREFLGRFTRAAFERGWLRLRLLEIEGEPVAGELAWRIGPSYALYQSGFDPAWARFSAGTLALVLTVRAGIEEGADEVDMLLGEEDYKQRFAIASRQVHTVVLARSLSSARLLVSAEAAARRRARGLAARPKLGRALKSAARLLPTGRRD
jgi:CelD/BcsL family acetyltransferase involved in cellulose biosynthesis